MSQMETPHILDSEHDPRILRDLAKLLDAENRRLKSVIHKIQVENDKRSQQVISFEESLKILRKKYFGKKSERSTKPRERDRLNDDPELTLHSQNLLPPPKKKQTRSLETQEVVHESNDDDLKSMSESLGLENPSHHQWEEIPGLFDQSVEVTVVERQYKKILHKRKKYRLKKEFEVGFEKKVLIAAPGPIKLIPGGSYSIDFTVATIVDKYVNHIPLERQCRSMDSLGLHKMHTQVLYNLARVAGEHLAPIAKQIKDEILQQALVHSDETKWPINNGKDSDGYMWILSNNRGSHYRFEPTRSGKVVKESLEGFEGIVMSDAYSGYYQFKKSQTQALAICHAHARRNFWDIKEDNPIANEIIDMWDKLFKFERLARNFDELLEIRQTRSKPLIDEMKKWLTAQLIESRPETHMRKAIQYCFNHWVELTKFLENPIIPLSNNEAERTIRHAVMGRKNFYGSRSIDGADLTATMYTIIESCKKVELDPRDYLSITLRKSAAGEPTETPFELVKRQRQ